MVTSQQTAIEAIERAISETELAYKFNANSYTASAFTECLAARDALETKTAPLPDWMTAYCDYHS